MYEANHAASFAPAPQQNTQVASCFLTANFYTHILTPSFFQGSIKMK